MIYAQSFQHELVDKEYDTPKILTITNIYHLDMVVVRLIRIRARSNHKLLAIVGYVLVPLCD